MVPFSIADALSSDAFAGDFAGLGAFAGIWVLLIIFLILFIIFSYIFMGIAMMTTAKRLNTNNPWLAWIPIGNMFLMANMAGMHWWPILLMIPYTIFYVMYMALMTSNPIMAMLLLGLAYIPMLIYSVFQVIWQWKICEKRGKAGWWALLTIIIPFWSFVMWGILAWSKEESKAFTPSASRRK